MPMTQEEKQKLFKLLDSRGVFEQKNAKITLCFDHLGILQTIQRDDYLFNRRFEK